jgi:hypothetical protein
MKTDKFLLFAIKAYTLCTLPIWVALGCLFYIGRIAIDFSKYMWEANE